MELKTSELAGSALRWAVAKCEGWVIGDDMWITDPKEPGTGQPLSDFQPDSDWSQGGPIIEREIVSLDAENGRARWKACAWRKDGDLQSAIGPSPLIAAMRCYIASKLGDTVTIPDELC